MRKTVKIGFEIAEQDIDDIARAAEQYLQGINGVKDVAALMLALDVIQLDKRKTYANAGLIANHIIAKRCY